MPLAAGLPVPGPLRRERSDLPTALEVFPARDEPLSPQAEARWIWALLAIGLAARLVRYLLRFPLWEDECMLSSNYLDRGYLDLLQPLGYYQVCPPLFLWGQLTVVKLLGFNEYALRLIPLVCSVGSLFLFRHLAGRLLRGSALVLAVGVFAVSYPMIRYAAEAKPYAGDLLLSLAMMALVIEWLRRPERNGWLWALAAIIAPAVGCSYPAVFVGGGLSLVVGYVLVRGRGADCQSASSDGRLATCPTTWRAWLPWCVYNAALVAGFLALLAVNRLAVGERNMDFMVTDWAGMFPPLGQPLRLAWWLLATHCGGMMAFPLGGPNWGSAPIFPLFVIGVVVLVRRRAGVLLVLLLAPLGLNLIAAAMQRFPYGSHPRMSLYMAGPLSILIALGIAAALRWASTRGSTRSSTLRVENLHCNSTRRAELRPLAVVLALLVAVAAGVMLRDLSHPYKSGTTLRAGSSPAGSGSTWPTIANWSVRRPICTRTFRRARSSGVGRRCICVTSGSARRATRRASRRG